MWFILGDNNETIPTTSGGYELWRRMNPDRISVGNDEFEYVRVSTVFLGIDHSHIRGSVILFETMVFGGDFDEFMWRYSTYGEALAGHQIVVTLVDHVISRAARQIPSSSEVALLEDPRREIVID